MKKVFYALFIFTVMAFYADSLRAAPVDTLAAKNIAKQYLSTMVGDGTRSNQQARVTYIGSAASDSERVCYYVINFEPSGFVIVSADDRATPILAYSATDHFDAAVMPNGMRVLLNSLAEEIRALNPDDTATLAIQQKWQALANGTMTPRFGNSVDPLIQTHWGQSSSDTWSFPYFNSLCLDPLRATYNRFCPYDNHFEAPNRHVHAGCVAVALAQLIRYWEYPYVGKGSHTYEANFSHKGYGDYGSLNADFGSTYYNYELMPDQITIDSAGEKIDAVAQLIYHCGVATNMMYSVHGSYTAGANMQTALTQYFRFPSGGERIFRANYDNDTWINLLKAELDAGRPILYEALDNTSSEKDNGHGFICDGYNTDNFFHFNWGWNGDYDDTWYPLSAMTPGNYTYSALHGAYIGIGDGLEREKPSVATELISCNSQSINVKGALLYDGNSQVTETGFVYGTSATPTIGNATKIQVARDYNQMFTYSITNVQPNTIYHVRAYATNSHGTVYGEEEIAFTSDHITIVFHKNDGTQVIATQQYPSFGNHALSHNFTRPGHTLRVWNTAADGSGSSYSNGYFLYPIVSFGTNQVDLYALWNDNASCTVAHVKNNETGDGNTITAVSDHQGNSYGVVQIGNQCWMSENLRCTTTPTGTSLLATPSMNLIQNPVAAFHIYDNQDNDQYGLLYTWYAARDAINVTSDDRGICPEGWHLPTTGSDSDWGDLTKTLKLPENSSFYRCGISANNIAKSLASDSVWFSSQVACAVGNSREDNNTSGLNLLPIGGRFGDDGYKCVKEKAFIWSATAKNSEKAYVATLARDGSTFQMGSEEKINAFSVRCVRDLDTMPVVVLTLPEVFTNEVTAITDTSATCGGNITSDGGAEVTARGVCWSNQHNPTIADTHTTDSIGIGAFTSLLTGLTGSTTYYVRAYATNSVGTAYGQERSFTTLTADIPDGQPCPNAPTLTDYDGNVYNTVKIGQQCWMKENLRTTHYADGTSVPAGGNSYSDTLPYFYDYSSSGIPLSERGYLYNWTAATKGTPSSSTSPIGTSGICPTGWHLPNNAEWDQLIAYLGGQSEYICGNDSTYIAKALASPLYWSNSTTSCAVGNNTSINNASGFSALPVGEWNRSYGYRRFGWITCFWSSDVTSYTPRGYYYELLYPGADVFQGFTYYDGYSVRCVLGSNSLEPGEETILPEVSSSSVADITATSAVSGGNIISDGGTEVTARGVCWSTLQNPTIMDTHTTNGSGTGAFSCLLSGLSNGTTYYMRAYATNSAGTAYGEEVSFTTLAAGGSPIFSGQPCPGVTTVTDYDGNVYNTIQIGNQCWTRENLRTTHYADGTAIPAGGNSSSFDVPYRYSPNDDPNNVIIYGYLYNWPAVVYTSSSTGVTGICPTGWHAPSYSEWLQMENYVSSVTEHVCNNNSNYIAKSLAATTGWNYANGECLVGDNPSTNNSTGFNAYPAGLSAGTAPYVNFGVGAYFWTTTEIENSTTSAYRPFIANSLATILITNYSKCSGHSVRCLRDAGISATADTSSEDSILENHPPQGTFRFPSEQEDISNMNACMVYMSLNNETTASQLAATDYEVITEVRDHQNNTYSVVQIGNQCWMRQNMRCTTSPSTGTFLVDTACHLSYVGKKAYLLGNDSDYGLLYNWNAAVDTFNTAFGETSTSALASAVVNALPTGFRRGICPDGWHIPSSAEWVDLDQFVSSQPDYWCGYNDESTAKSLSSVTGWTTSGSLSVCDAAYDTTTNNATGFSALPAGWCIGSIQNNGSQVAFTSLNGNQTFGITAAGDTLWTSTAEKSYGLSVRCVRNTLPTVVTKAVSTPTFYETLASGEVVSEGDAPVLERGVICRNVNGSIVHQTSDGFGTGIFVSALLDLQPDADYEVRAYASNCNGTAYGDWIAFHTPCLSFYTENNQIACSDYLWGDSLITQSGTYTKNLASQTGCDSIVQLHLYILETNVFDTTIYACGGYLYHDSLYTHSQTIHDSITDYGDCVIYLNTHLFVQEQNTSLTDTAIDVYTWHGQTYTENGTYLYMYTTDDGCIVVDTLHLTIVHCSNSSTNQTVCNSFVWNGQTYTQSGTYTYEYTNEYGCENVDTLHLTINPIIHTNLQVSACNSYLWNGETYTEPGNYSQTFTSSAGCDSLVTMQLTLGYKPVMSAISGASFLCSNQFAKYYYNISDPSFHYRWYKDNVLVAENQSSITLHEPHLGQVFLKMQVIDNQNICQSDTTLYVQISDNAAPDTVNVRRNGSTNILLCDQVTSDFGIVHYRWGYTDRLTAVETVLDGDNNYCLFTIGIDTFAYDYWVETYINYEDGTSCANRSYYGNSYLSSTEEFDGNIVNAYLSGNHIHLFVNALEPTNTSAILYDANGRQLLTRHYGVTNEVTDNLPADFACGVYILRVSLDNRNYPFKLVICR